MTVVSIKRLRAIFNGMRDRCYNPRNKAFRFYGGMGVTICDEWLADPKRFESWALAHGYTDKLTIDRIDSAKGYSPANCRWVSKHDNAKWKATTNHFTVNGVTNSGRGWAEQLALSPNYINTYARAHTRAETEQLIADIMTGKRQVASAPRLYTVNGTPCTLTEIAARFSISKAALTAYLHVHGEGKLIDKVQALADGRPWSSWTANNVEIDGVVKTKAEWSRAVHRHSSYFSSYESTHGRDFAIMKIKQLMVQQNMKTM